MRWLPVLSQALGQVANCRFLARRLLAARNGATKASPGKQRQGSNAKNYGLQVSGWPEPARAVLTSVFRNAG